jgi:hypothetical protein
LKGTLSILSFYSLHHVFPRSPCKLISCRADNTSPQIKSLLKRKRDYLAQLQISIKEVAKKEELARKRAREELPSEDELPSSGGNGGNGTAGGGKRMRENSGKRKRARRREGREGRERVMEEEIVVPRITQHSTIPPWISFYSPRLFLSCISIPDLTLRQVYISLHFPTPAPSPMCS